MGVGCYRKGHRLKTAWGRAIKSSGFDDNRLRPVEKGIENDDFIEIKEGLKAGNLVIAEPDNSIRESSNIRAK